MKKCPTCQKTFDDNMRFCQTDGTPLVDDEPAFDPYATIVGTTASVGAAPPSEPESEPENPTVGSLPISEPDDMLDLPPSDPLKTMYASDAEMKEILGEQSGNKQADDEPQIEILEPEAVASSEPPPPSFGDMSPPPSPFAADDSSADLRPSPPSEPITPDLGGHGTPAFSEAETVVQSPSYGSQTASPFEPEPQAPVEQWTPPPAPEPAWQSGSQAPMSTVTEGQNKTLAIISLVTGILSLICCSWFLPGIAAIVLGFIARGKANSDPANYGGAGLALGGIITGAISIVLGIIVVILYLAGALAGSLGNF